MNAFFDQIAYFFASLTTESKLILAIIGLLLFTLGLILGWLIQRRSTRAYLQQVRVLKTERDTLEAQRIRLTDQHKALARELEVTSTEKVEALDRIQALEAQLAEAAPVEASLREQIERLQTSNRSYVATIEALNDQVIGLKTQNERLLEDTHSGSPNAEEDDFGRDYTVSLPNAKGGEQGNHAQSETESDTDTDEDREVLTQLSERLQFLEDRMASLAERQELFSAGSPPNADASAFLTTPAPAAAPENLATPVATDADGEPLVIRADITEPGVRTDGAGQPEVIVQSTPSLQTSQIDVPDEERDDLTAIDKIGPFLQRQLYGVDVYRYEQIASWSEADIITYTELIGYLPGMIERDDWVGQAKRLAEASGKSAPTPAESTLQMAAEVPNGEDGNLRIVEGIGPSIEALLKSNGIDTLGKLANAETEDIQYILDSAGGSYRFHDPGTWVAQAGLAADGKSEELRRWQEELIGGR